MLCAIGLDEGVLGRIVARREEHLKPTLQVLALALLPASERPPLGCALPALLAAPRRASSGSPASPSSSSSSSSGSPVSSIGGDEPPTLATARRISALLSDGHFKFWAQVGQTAACRRGDQLIDDDDDDDDDERSAASDSRPHLEEGAVIRLLSYCVAPTTATDTTPKMTIASWEKLTTLPGGLTIGRPHFFAPEFQRTDGGSPSRTPIKPVAPRPSPPEAPQKRAAPTRPRTLCNPKRQRQLEFGSLDVEKQRASAELQQPADATVAVAQHDSPLSSDADSEGLPAKRPPAAPVEPRHVHLPDALPHMTNFFVEVRIDSRSPVKTWTTAHGRTGKLFWADVSDARGARMRCTVYNSLADRYYDCFAAGAVLRLHNAIVRPANPKFCTYAAYELSIASKTAVTPLPDFSPQTAATEPLPLADEKPTLADFEVAAELLGML